MTTVSPEVIEKLKSECKKFIWKFRYTARICKRFRDYQFWSWWWISVAATEDNCWNELDPEDAADEELTYWND